MATHIIKIGLRRAGKFVNIICGPDFVAGNKTIRKFPKMVVQEILLQPRFILENAFGL